MPPAVEIIDLTGDSPPPKVRKTAPKRKAADYDPQPAPKKTKGPKSKPTGSFTSSTELLQDIEDSFPLAKKARASNPKSDSLGESSQNTEKRLRTFRKQEPQAYLQIKERALSQKFFVIDRQRRGAPEDPSEEILIAGSTGNVYTIKIGQQSSCNCPHAQKGNQCKHIVFALIRVLKAPAQLQYQLALLPSELRIIFEGSPPITNPEKVVKETEDDGSRKPIEGDCPICFMPMESDNRSTILYCKAACGNNFHTECFNQWGAAKRETRAKVTCPLCRTEWENDEATTGDVGSIRRLAQGGFQNEEGYVNVASQLGLTGERDYSTYHSYWVNSRRGGGGGGWTSGRDRGRF